MTVELKWISDQVAGGDLDPRIGANLALMRIKEIKNLNLDDETDETLVGVYKEELKEIAGYIRRNKKPIKQIVPRDGFATE